MKIELDQYFDWVTFVAEENDQLLGFVSGRVYMEDDRILDKVGYIEELFVTEKARGRKLGLSLMEKILAVLADEGCTVYRTSAYSNNPAALSLYRKLGFLDEAIELARKVVK
jgi:diamine N-acetyltransferase